jgi:hypothetical protein
MISPEVFALARRVDDTLIYYALRRVEAARAEFERAQAVCDRWTQACGIKVWRESHPLDREKLRQRRLAKRRLAHELRHLDDLRRMNAQLPLVVSPVGSA